MERSNASPQKASASLLPLKALSISSINPPVSAHRSTICAKARQSHSPWGRVRKVPAPRTSTCNDPRDRGIGAVCSDSAHDGVSHARVPIEHLVDDAKQHGVDVAIVFTAA